ncbi:hypothetical protein RUM44_000242 [Polyplax serrata]|uniref:Uncharacterized protein n=1 Tax=Polyplax serrata TaxID=468196 RepID=A0ABR1B4W5_POLSC
MKGRPIRYIKLKGQNNSGRPGSKVIENAIKILEILRRRRLGQRHGKKSGCVSGRVRWQVRCTNTTGDCGETHIGFYVLEHKDCHVASRDMGKRETETIEFRLTGGN